MNKKFFVTALSSLLAVSALAGCSGGGGSTPSGGSSTPAPAATSEAGGGESSSTTPQVLRFGCSGYDIVLNPILSSNVYDGWANDLMFQGLTKTNSSGEYVEGDITDSIELSEDKLTYTFTLKDNVTFSDGSPMTAEDVEFTYMTMKDPDYTGPRSGVAATYDSVEVIDDTHVAFHMVAASPANLQNFTYGVLSKAHYAYSSMEEFEAKNNDPMGTGPFRLESAQAKQYINLVKNENYWDTANTPTLDGVQFLEVSEEALLPALQNKEIDFAQPAAKLENVEAVDEMADTHLVSYLANGYTFMCFNTTRPTLEDVNVRQALVYALDRRNFLLAEYGSNELVALGMCPISKTSWAYPGDDELNAYEYDLEKAASMLDEAGWTDSDGDGVRDKDGVKLSLDWLVYPEATWPGTLSGMAYDSWKQIGVELNIKTLDFNTVAEIAMDAAPGEKDFDIYTMGFSLSADPDPTGGLFDYDAYSAGGYNASGFYDERSQELIKLGLAEFDQDKRAEIYKEWATRQNELLPTLIVAYRSEIWAINNYVHGLDDIGVYTDWTTLIKDVTMD